VSGRLLAWGREAVTTPSPGPAQRAARRLLGVAALGYGVAVRTRNAAFDAALLPARRLPCRVLCVGNLTTGGTGKTPTVLWLAGQLAAAGERVAVLSRGYGRRGDGIAVVSDPEGVRLAWPEAGDEAFLLARGLPGVPVIVGADRVAAGRLAIARFDAKTLVLDDGFQHRRLRRDVDLVLLDGADPFGGGNLLPRGLLREPMQGLARAHAVLVTRAETVTDRAALAARIGGLAPGRPVAFATHRPVGLLQVPDGGQTPALERLQGRAVAAVSGIAGPEGFHRALERLGAHLAARLVYPDHHPFSPSDVRHFLEAARAAGAEWIVTTEKDAVRLAGESPRPLPIYALRIRIEIEEGRQALAAALGLGPEDGGRG
jgi:tetraacyldisaccharide 4'-kinase